MSNPSVFVVTVTYGDRKGLLRQVLNAVVQNVEVSRVIVINNGALWPVRDELAREYPDLVDIIELGRNTGSAVGFSTGIQRALDLGAEYVWLLDDDNCPRDDTLRILSEAYSQEMKVTPRNRLAVVAFRSEHQADVAMGVPEHRINPRANSFHGFHVLDIPYKIWRRTPWGKPRVHGGPPATVLLQTAPYSGLLFHRDLMAIIGLPNPDFVLYGDDLEFTYRITRLDGRIVLVTTAMLDDLESSWNVKARFGNSFAGMLRGEGDFRAYYGMRNGVYFDTTNLKTNGFVFWFNRAVYMSLLFVFSLVLNKLGRYHLLRDAVQDGLAGRLGVDERFPL